MLFPFVFRSGALLHSPPEAGRVFFVATSEIHEKNNLCYCHCFVIFMRVFYVLLLCSIASFSSSSQLFFYVCLLGRLSSAINKLILSFCLLSSLPFPSPFRCSSCRTVIFTVRVFPLFSSLCVRAHATQSPQFVLYRVYPARSNVFFTNTSVSRHSNTKHLS